MIIIRHDYTMCLSRTLWVICSHNILKAHLHATLSWSILFIAWVREEFSQMKTATVPLFFTTALAPTLHQPCLNMDGVIKCRCKLTYGFSNPNKTLPILIRGLQPSLSFPFLFLEDHCIVLSFFFFLVLLKFSLAVPIFSFKPQPWFYSIWLHLVWSTSGCKKMTT